MILLVLSQIQVAPFFPSYLKFYLIFLHLLSPLLLRMEPSSTWRASTTRRWSTTLFWRIADTRTRTRSITATLGDAERGTAYQLASADRNHSPPTPTPTPPLPTFPPSPLRLQDPGSSFVAKEDGQADGPETSSFYSGAAATWNSSPHPHFLLLLLLSLPLDFCMTFLPFCLFSIPSLSVFLFLTFVSGQSVSPCCVCWTWRWCHIALFTSPRVDPCSQAACGSVSFFIIIFTVYT